MSIRYCTESDVRKEAPQGLFTNQARRVESVSTSTGMFVLDCHGFEEGQEVQMRSDVSLPSPFVSGASYYVVTPNEFSFCLASVAGGSPIVPTNAGDNVMVFSRLPFGEWIEWSSAFVQSFLPAHLVPTDPPYHDLIVNVTAQLAAARGLQFVGGTPQDISNLQKNAQMLLDKWAKHQPLRGPLAPRSSLMAVVSSVSRVDPRGWYPPGGGIP